MKTLPYLLILSLIFSIYGCRNETSSDKIAELKEGKEIDIKYASGFSIIDYGNYQVVTVNNPWPEADKAYKYLLAENNAEIPEELVFDQKIIVPVEEIVVTSTTHIPALEMLNEEASLVGFPGLSYISSEITRNRIAEGQVKELGKNEALNTESLLDLKPDVVVAFSIDGSNKSLNTIEKSGIPVVFNGDWTESSPLGKAEWIKFFGAFFKKNKEAQTIFNKIEKDYLEARELAQKGTSRPTVVSGAMYKDQWYLPAGNSWQAQFIEDAHADYVFKDTEGSGSLSLSLEHVLSEATDADYWVGPAQFQAYDELKEASPHYQRLTAFQEQNVFTFSSVRGKTDGVLFYELAPNRPDLVLKDLISIFHPQLLPNHQTTFYKPLK